MSHHADAPRQEVGTPQEGRPRLDLGPQSRLSDKKELRKQMDSVLSAVPDDEIQSQSAHATDVLLSMPEYQAAQTISIFMSMPRREIMTERIVRHALDAGKQVFIPYIYKAKEPRGANVPSSIMDMLQLASREDYASLKPDKWEIPSIDKASVDQRKNCFGGTGLTNGEMPASDAPRLDMIVTPSMAFDHEMNRLGHGKGYYDNFITRYCAQADGKRDKPFLVGFALGEQLLPPRYRLPTESWDWKVDAVVVGGVEGADSRVVRSCP
ncbi:hypothetical protein MBLNU459_g6559t1 [Dothideomycetes sp. NU459]